MRLTFITDLEVTKLARGTWRLLAPLKAAVLLDPGQWVFYTVPAGYETDFATVPRLPLAFLLAGDTAHKAAVLHDWLYEQRAPRAHADAVFDAAMKAEAVPTWRRRLMWAAVRVFGRRAYGRPAIDAPAPDPAGGS